MTTTTMSLIARAAVTAIIVVLAPFAPIRAAQPQPSGQDPSKTDRLASVPVRVEVQFTRFQGERKISSLPFTLLATANDQRSGPQWVSMRMGIDVPVGSATTTESRTRPTGSDMGSQSTGTTTTKVQYRNVGTDLDCQVGRLDESRFSVHVRVSDSSIYSPDGDSAKALRNPDPTAFRTFSTDNTVVVKDGQTVLFGVGTDKISGETLKIEVSLHLVK